MAELVDVEQLRGCPFCGSQPIEKTWLYPPMPVLGSAEKRHVWCTNCGAQGPSGTHEEAIGKWVLRANTVRPEGVDTFQERVRPWMMECFGAEISADMVERGDRVVEEMFELLQSGGYDPNRIAPLRDYVWGRPVGEPDQEVGGVMVTLAAYCLAAGIDMHGAGERELARILQPHIIEKIRAKQAAKPTGSALP